MIMTKRIRKVDNHYCVIKKTVAILMLALATVFFLIGCEEDPRVTYLNLRRIENDGGMVYDVFTEFQDSDVEFWIGGNTFGFSGSDLELAYDEDFYGVIEISENTDYLVAHFGSIASEDFYFILKVFINYEEVAFRVKGEEDYATEFVFLLESGYEVDIPFNLQLDLLDGDGIYKLTVAVFIDPNRDILNEDNFIYFQRQEGVALNNDLVLNPEGQIGFEAVPNDPIFSREEDTSFFWFWTAPEFRLNDHGFIAHPEFSIQASRGEEIELLFYASPVASYGYELKDYLIIGLLNWQQVPLNGDPFLFIDVGESEFSQVFDRGRFVLEGIDEVGFHDFIMILIPHPTYRNSLGNSFPRQISNRLVIEIVE